MGEKELVDRESKMFIEMLKAEVLFDIISIIELSSDTAKAVDDILKYIDKWEREDK